ncbi:MAG: hypothetical protein IPO29_16550 [Anaerolineae bacterium]|nr:hypothetical protein [Anaerolineae bacterium]
MRHFLHTWLRPSLLYALVALFVVWTMAPVVWIGTMSVQPEINYVSVPPHLSISDFSLRWATRCCRSRMWLPLSGTA